ncbi:MAG: hypothetical protein RBS50_03590 [Phenylobacterium sp.]|jgi:uncharacterized membrane protein YkoI|uniref:PepSY domain-containing protein n=1 Tax=Phenylobacterium sp. TaxID=1871053 RepID=UPI002A359EF4|nr:hypothetical protein [Phenylobacterium sp.]MDX9997024.1 hypothetical protein [Phenylobacterium sp.]
MKRFLAIAAILLAAAPAAQAQPWRDDRPSLGAGGRDQDHARDAVRRGRQAPLARVLGSIAQQTPGRHLNTTQSDYAGRPAYYVQWQMPDGRVVIFIVDAESGAMLARQGG